MPPALAGYRRSWLRTDVIAGVTLAVITIPECMGYASIAQVPLQYGLYTVLFPTVAFALLGASRIMVVGADSATAAILSSGLIGLGVLGLRPQSHEWVALCALTALITGAILAIAAVLRLGFLGDFLSTAVLIGFLTGVGFQVASGQLPEMLGIEKPSGEWLWQQWHLLNHLGGTNLSALTFTTAGLLVMLVMKRWTPKIPGAIVVVVVGIVVVALAHPSVAVVGHLPSGLPRLSVPTTLRLSDLTGIGAIAFGCAVVILAQSAATARSFAAKYGQRADVDRDIVGLTVANLVAGFTSTFVVNGSPTKTKIVDEQKGRTQAVNLVLALCTALVLVFLTGVLADLPKPVLGSIVFLIGVDLVDIAGMKVLWSIRRIEFWVALVTAITVCVAGVQQGILLAVVASVLAIMGRLYRPQRFVVGVREDGQRRYISAKPGEQSAAGLIIFRYDAQLFFANANRFFDNVVAMVDGAPDKVRWLVLDCSVIDDVDYSATRVLAQLIEYVHSKGAAFVVSGIDPGLWEDLSRLHVSELIRPDHIFPSLDETIEAFVKRHGDASRK